jgi:hypothetical protein
VFLQALNRSGSVSEAARKAGVNECSPYKHRRKSPDFAAAWDRAVESAEKRAPSWEGRFLRALRKCGEVKDAVDKAGTSTTEVYRQR